MFNLVPLFHDAVQLLRLRYQAAEHYRYSPAVYPPLLLAVGMAGAAGFVPVLGLSAGTAAFAVGNTVLRWWVLSRCMRMVLHYFGSPRLPLSGYVLVTEALILPSVLVFYLPETAPFWLLWNAWAFWVQAIGFHHLSRQHVGKILLAYLLYALVSSVAGAVLMLLLVQAGWLDINLIMQNLEKMGMTLPFPVK